MYTVKTHQPQPTSSINLDPNVSQKRPVQAEDFLPAKQAKTDHPDVPNVILVDSGVGGAMAGKLVDGSVKEFGSNVCLPIGDKPRAQIETYTAQMVAQGLMKADHVIIACNTASTAKKEAIGHLTAFIHNQVDPNNRPSLPTEQLHRCKELAAGLEKDPNYLHNKVHEIVVPTAERAAGKAAETLLAADKVGSDGSYSILVDSTDGTAKSGAYRTAIIESLDAKMEAQGFERKGMASVSNEQQTLNKSVFEYRNDAGVLKEVAIQSRGNAAWVPAIEANTIGNRHGQETLADKLVANSRNASDALKFSGNDTGKNALFERAPNLNMLCCTHYPAMREALASNWGPTTEFLQQDEVVRDMTRGLRGSEGSATVAFAAEKVDVTLGDHTLAPSDLDKKRDLLNKLLHPNKEATVGKLSEPDGKTYQSIHRDMEFNAERPGRTFVGSGTDKVLHMQEESGIRTAWKQDRFNPDVSQRANARLVGGINASIPDKGSDVKKAVEASSKFLEQHGVPGAQIGDMYRTIGSLARLNATGETRGVDILAQYQEPAAELFNASVDLAEVFKGNEGKAGADRASVGIVTGFTVVNPQGEKIAGENDGPGGAIVLAKQCLDHNTPAVVVIDSGSEASVFAAAKAAGLVVKDGNAPGIDAKARTFADAKLVDGLTFEVVEHGVDKPSANPKTVGDVNARMHGEYNTKLVISIERPGPNVAGRLSDMRGNDISRFNADLSPLVTDPGRAWKTIGIGDGGNETGTGSANPQVKGMRKPDFTPVVNNGDKIAAESKTDRMVLSSVSNNGGVVLAMASGEVAKSLGLTSTAAAQQPSSSLPTDAAGNIVSTYKSVIDSMYREGISLDGVNKVNAQTVDGRTLHRPEGQAPIQPGQPGATHDDMFEQMLDIVRHGAGR